MGYEISRLARDDGTAIALYTWPRPAQPPRAAVQIAHGLAEHAARYDRFAQVLTRAGYAVFASDHRGHGQTAPTDGDLGHFADRDGFARVVEDLYAVNRHIATALPGVDRVLFAHSFGSFVVQDYLATHGDSVSAVVLSGTDAGRRFLARLGNLVARLERWRRGARSTSPLLQRLSFGDFNKAFAPARTEFDWLSRDATEVDKYVQDARCGFASTTQSFVDLTAALVRINGRAHRDRVPKELPIYVFAGTDDPVGRGGRGPTALAAAYQRAGLRHVTLRLYPGARHETLNETNRNEVMGDLLDWLAVHVPKR